MALIADGLLIAAALAAALYCHVLALRLRKLREMDGGVGAAIAAMSRQVEEMRAALAAARAVSGESTRSLGETTARAEMAAGRLELLLAAIHDRDGARPLDLAGRRGAGRGMAAVGPAGLRPAGPAAGPTRRMSRTDAPADPAASSPVPALEDDAPDRQARGGDDASAAPNGDDRAATLAAQPPNDEASAAAPPLAVAASGGRGAGEAAALRSALEALAREGER